jgi:hypothetical protein
MHTLAPTATTAINKEMQSKTVSMKDKSRFLSSGFSAKERIEKDKPTITMPL